MLSQNSTRKKNGLFPSNKVVNWIVAALLIGNVFYFINILAILILVSEQAAVPFPLSGDLRAHSGLTIRRTQSHISRPSNKLSIDLNDESKHPPNNTNVNAQRKTQNIASNGILRLEKCPWMTIPKASRYPRKSMQVQSKEGSTSNFYNCFGALNDKWQKQKLRYVPVGGFLLSAIARGEFHGHSNDMDLDTIVLGQMKMKNVGCEGVQLGSWGKRKMKIYPNQTYLPPLGPISPDVIPLCECELWDLPIPCLEHTVDFLEWDYGPSWWFPVTSSKGTGWRIVDRVLAKGARTGEGWKKLDQNVFDMLKGLDKDGDKFISMSEFVTAVTSNKDLNLNWIRYQVKNNPCMMIDNARNHFNSMLGFFELYFSGDIEGARQFLGDPFDAFVGYADNRTTYASVFPYKYLPRRLFNLEENEKCATAVEEAFNGLLM